MVSVHIPRRNMNRHHLLSWSSPLPASTSPSASPTAWPSPRPAATSPSPFPTARSPSSQLLPPPRASGSLRLVCYEPEAEATDCPSVPSASGSARRRPTSAATDHQGSAPRSGTTPTFFARSVRHFRESVALPGERRRAGSACRDPKPPASGEGDMFSDDHSNLLVPRRMPADRIRCEADHFLRLCDIPPPHYPPSARGCGDPNPAYNPCVGVA